MRTVFERFECVLNVYGGAVRSVRISTANGVVLHGNAGVAAVKGRQRSAGWRRPLWCEWCAGRGGFGRWCPWWWHFSRWSLGGASRDSSTWARFSALIWIRADAFAKCAIFSLSVLNLVSHLLNGIATLPNDSPSCSPNVHVKCLLLSSSTRAASHQLWNHLRRAIDLLRRALDHRAALLKSRISVQKEHL